MSTTGSEVLRLWEESAPYWEKYSQAIRAMFEPLSVALIQDAGIASGHFVLDVAGGTGNPSIEVAEVCGSSGRVICSDAIWAMVASARRNARERALSSVHFVQCLGDALPFAEGLFDAVVCRLGVMFFPDPILSLREMLRLLKSKGRLSLAVWYDSQVNPFFAVMPPVLSRYVPMPAADPDAPGAFRFAERGKLAAHLSAAGATQVQERILEFRIEAPVPLRDFWMLRREMSETLRTKAKHLSPGQTVAVERDVQEAARKFFPNDRMSFPAQCLIVTGEK